jgi:WbqC-like protein family
MNLIVDSQYFPSIILYKISYNFSNIIFEQCESYQKMSFRNRCQISGAQGVIDLSIPLVGGRDQKGLMRDVRIDPRRTWQDQHWKTIVSCYNRSPWFDYYRDGLEKLFRKPADFLTDWNLSCFEWTLQTLGWSPTVGLTTEYRREYLLEEGVDWRGKLMPRDREKWETGLLKGTATSRYNQVFEDRMGFIPNLSILDLLFCEGKEAIRYIRSSNDGKLSPTAAEASPT